MKVFQNLQDLDFKTWNIINDCFPDCLHVNLKIFRDKHIS